VADQVRFEADAIAAAAGGAVLDVPVGTGLVLERALPPSGGLVVAVDLSPSMLHRARRRLGDRIVYVRADVSHLPFRDGAFAAIHSASGFHLFPDRATAAVELVRSLRAGGLAAILTFTDRGHRITQAYQRLLARRGLLTAPASVADHVHTFEAAGLEERSSTLGGTMLRWTGLRP
jgi:ubiquinone/menaquinone biosynthesis C-methylase UbiE